MARVSVHVKQDDGELFCNEENFLWEERARGLDERSGVGPTIERGT